MIAQRGDAVVLEDLLGSLDEEDWFASAALEGGLLKLYEVRRDAVLSGLRSRLSDSNPTVKSLVRGVIWKIAKRGDAKVIEELWGSLEEECCTTDEPRDCSLKLYETDKHASLRKPLLALQVYLNKMSHAKKVDNASYLAAVSRFKNDSANDPLTLLFQQAIHYPEPIRSWLMTIANSSWKVLLRNSKTYLNSVWNTLVWSVYENEIRGRYPIFSDSRENISLKNFNDYFGPNGTIGAFYVYYLQPFINMGSNYWSLKKLNGASIDISRNSLDMFIRASLIQQMFFTDNHSTPGFRFTLAPTFLSSNLKEIAINLGGQTYHAYPQQEQSKIFSWPAKASFITIVFTTKKGKTQTIALNGPWALFRLIDQSTLQTTGNPRIFTLIFKSGDDTARFKLTADHRVNPFIPGVISKYRCPNRL